MAQHAVRNPHAPNSTEQKVDCIDDGWELSLEAPDSLLQRTFRHSAKLLSQQRDWLAIHLKSWVQPARGSAERLWPDQRRDEPSKKVVEEIGLNNQ